MSLVSPRPERPGLAARIEREVPGLPSRCVRVRSGIIGLARAVGPYGSHLRRKLACDDRYIDAVSPWLDVRVMRCGDCGKESPKVNQDCTICRPCRWTETDSIMSR